MKIQCPHCGVNGSADDSYQGRQVKCPKCRGIFAVTAELAAVPPGEVAVSAVLEEPVAPEDSPTPDRVADIEKSGAIEDILADDILADDIPEESEEKAEDLADILALEGMAENEPTEPATGSKTDDAANDVLAWSDIVTEIDEEMAEDARREKESEGAPAALHDFFSDIPPAAAEAGETAAAPVAEVAVEDVMPLADEDVSGAELSAAVPRQTDTDIPEEVVDQPYGLEKEQCWQCGKKDSVGVPFIAKDGRLYCPDCAPPDTLENDVFPPIGTDVKKSGPSENNAFQDAEERPFTIGGSLQEAWAGTKGVKAAIWAGTAVMYLVLLLLGTAGAFLLPSQQAGYGDAGLGGIVSGTLFPLVVNAISMIFSAGLLLIGIRKVAGENYTWKMVFDGFPVAGKIVGAFILQTLLVIVGFLLLILPGIYLLIGYLMTMPLIIDRKMSPWQAMETSRKAIHGHWWKIFGLSVVMSLLFLVSMIPLGIGLVWTWPMFIVLGGVVYRCLFGIGTRIE